MRQSGTQCGFCVAEWDEVGYFASCEAVPGWRGSSHSATRDRLTIPSASRLTCALAFTGTFEHTLDAKNRLTIPSKFRAELSKGVYLSRAIENVHLALSGETYTAMADQALAQFTNPLSAQARGTRRLLYGTALETELDSAGRVMLTPKFLEHAGIGREVVITGVGDCLEIWDRSAWADYDTDLTARAPDLTESLGHTS